MMQQAVTLLRVELQNGPISARVILNKARTLGLNRDYLKAGKKHLGIIATRESDARNGRVVGWRCPDLIYVSRQYPVDLFRIDGARMHTRPRATITTGSNKATRLKTSKRGFVGTSMPGWCGFF